MTEQGDAVRAFIAAAWKRASEALDDARDNAERGRAVTAVNRAYYSVLYAARALLATRGYRPKSHSGTQTLLGQEFVRTGALPR